MTYPICEKLTYVGYLNSDNGDYGLRNPNGPEARLSRKTARQINGKVLCSACMFAPQSGREGV